MFCNRVPFPVVSVSASEKITSTSLNIEQDPKRETAKNGEIVFTSKDVRHFREGANEVARNADAAVSICHLVSGYRDGDADLR